MRVTTRSTTTIANTTRVRRGATQRHEACVPLDKKCAGGKYGEYSLDEERGWSHDFDSWTLRGRRSYYQFHMHYLVNELYARIYGNIWIIGRCDLDIAGWSRPFPVLFRSHLFPRAYFPVYIHIFGSSPLISTLFIHFLESDRSVNG